MFSSYDSWKTTEPDCDGHECASCGEWMIYSAYDKGWICEHCDERECPDPDALYDAWRDRQMEEGP